MPLSVTWGGRDLGSRLVQGTLAFSLCWVWGLQGDQLTQTPQEACGVGGGRSVSSSAHCSLNLCPLPALTYPWDP